MKLLVVLLTYLGAGAGLLAALMGGVLWLVRPDPTIAQERRVPPIPPRIADSIERKKAPPAPVTPAALIETNVEPEATKPAMKEADAALTQAPLKVQIRETKPRRPIKPKPGDGRSVASHEATPAREAPAPGVRPLARSDFPYSPYGNQPTRPDILTDEHEPRRASSAA